MDEMWNEELFVLQWLEADDVYQVLDLVFIEEDKTHKHSFHSKGKSVVEEEEAFDEGRFRSDLQ